MGKWAVYRILIVSPEASTCEALRRIATPLGALVEPVAASRLSARLRLPWEAAVIDGAQRHWQSILRELRRARPAVPVLLVAGRSRRLELGGLRAGAWDVLTTPLQPLEVRRRLAHAIRLSLLRRRQAHLRRELNRVRRLYRYLAESSPDLIYTLDQQGNFSYVNPSFERLLGYPSREILGRHYSEIIVPVDLPGSAHVFNERRTGARASAGAELRLLQRSRAVRRQTAGELPVEVNAQGIYESRSAGEASVFCGTCGVARDIRVRKALEKQLQQEEKMEAVYRLAGGIAHDFNNYLSAIVGNIGLARMRLSPGPELDRHLAEMERASLRARDLTRQLLAFAKGGQPIKRAGSLAELVRETASFVLRSSLVRPTFHLPQDLWNAEFDAGQVGQVVQNLVVNADQAMPAGGELSIRGENVTVGARSYLPLAAGRYVRIAVRDHGCGIPPENIRRVFDPFFTTKKNGNGFGLATAYSIMKRHGGYLTVRSRPAEGTVFFFYLPATDSPPSDCATREQELRPGQGRVLVMDDDAALQQVYRRLLTHLGYAPEITGNGPEAIARYRDALGEGRPFRAVLLNLSVRGAIGARQAVEELLRLDPAARLIVCSGCVSDPVMTDCRRHGFLAALQKPFSAFRLSEVLAEVLSAPPVAQEA